MWDVNTWVLILLHKACREDRFAQREPQGISANNLIFIDIWAQWPKNSHVHRKFCGSWRCKSFFVFIANTRWPLWPFSGAPHRLMNRIESNDLLHARLFTVCGKYTVVPMAGTAAGLSDMPSPASIRTGIF